MFSGVCVCQNVEINVWIVLLSFTSRNIHNWVIQIVVAEPKFQQPESDPSNSYCHNLSPCLKSLTDHLSKNGGTNV